MLMSPNNFRNVFIKREAILSVSCNSKGCGCDYEWMYLVFPLGWFLERGFEIRVWRLVEDIENVCEEILSILMGACLLLQLSYLLVSYGFIVPYYSGLY